MLTRLKRLHYALKRLHHLFTARISVRLCRFALVEIEDMDAFGREAVRCLVTEQVRTRSAEWLGLLDGCLAAAGGLDGVLPKSAEAAVERRYSAKPFVFDGRPRRDERFPDPYNMGWNTQLKPIERHAVLYFIWIGHHGDIAHWGLGFDNAGPQEVDGTGEFPAEDAIWNTLVPIQQSPSQLPGCG
jgi:hypothetical protein